ncbi:MAG: AsmA-like C-terminal region-containing protein [Pseudomonadota bacterium]
MSSTEPASPLPKRQRKTLNRLRLVGGMLVTLVFTAVLGVVMYVAIGRPVAAPDWVRAEVEARAGAALGQASLRFDALDLVVEEGTRPQVRMRNVQLLTDTGAEVAAFGEMRVGLSLTALLQGDMRVTDVSVSGIFAKLRREVDGSVSLSGGLDLSAPNRAAATLPELIEQADEALLRPAFAALQSVDIQSLTLRVEDVRSNRAWTVDGGRVRLARENDILRITSDLALLSGGTGVATLEANYESRVGDVAASFGANIRDVAAGDIATLAPPFAWLDVLRAPISGAMRGGIGSDGRLAPLNATLTIGTGVIQPTDATRPVPFDAARSYFTYDPEARVLSFDELSVESAWITTRIEGQTVLGLTPDGQLDDLVGQFRTASLTANPAGLYDAPVDFEAAEMEFRLALDPFRLDVGQALFQDQGQTFLARGQLEASADGWRYGVDGQMDGMSPTRLLALWPEGAVPKTRQWLVDNLLAGGLSNIDVVLRDAGAGRPTAYLSFDYHDAHVRFANTLPPVADAHGSASLLDNRFVVTVDAGQVTPPSGGAMDVAGSAFIIPDVAAKDGTPAVVRLRSDSTITAGLSLLDMPPLSLMEKAGLTPDLAQGRVLAQGTLALPLRKGIKGSDLVFDAAGRARDVRSTALVDGRTLAAETLSITASNRGVTISGPGTLDGVAFDATWSQPIGQGPQGSRVAGTLDLSPETVRTFDLGLPPGMLSGQGQGDFTLALPVGGDAPAFTLESDLRGLALSSPPLGWRKGAGTPGALSLAGRLGATPRVDRLSLDAPGLAASGTIALAPGGGLERARFDRVRVGGWLDAPVDLIGRGRGAAPRVEVRGGTLDLRQADFGGAASGSGGGQGGGPLTLALDRLQVTDTIGLTGLRGQFNMAQGLDGDFQASINNGTAIRGQVLPQNGRSAIRVTSDDAGGVAASAGILKQARGGALSLTLLPVGAASFDGTLKVQETRIQDAPAIAALLNALSIVGLLDQMRGSGIHFQEVEAAFRLTPSTMALTQASAVGPSMGLSMYGTYDVARSVLDMQGVVSPLYLVNGIGSIFTRKGEGLIGFNYALRGPSASPQVQVNPLSALTPGMFRDIFRTPAPQLPDVGVSADSPEAFAPETPTETNAERRLRLRQEARDNR